MLLLLDKLICNTTIGMKKSVKEAAKKAVV